MHTTISAMGAKQVRECCKLDAEGRGYLEHAMEQMNFSARAHDRILKVSRTLADLAGKQNIRPNDILRRSSSARSTGGCSSEVSETRWKSPSFLVCCLSKSSVSKPPPSAEPP